ncbi:MAG: hypothetical protein U0166_14695 [Acidobacteriota bacterium]
MMRLCNQVAESTSTGQAGGRAFYYQIGWVPAPCVASICSSDGARAAVNEALFFEGCRSCGSGNVSRSGWSLAGAA